MADQDKVNLQREYDELDKVLAAQPLLKAPRHTSARVMARLAALPQQTSVANLNSLNIQVVAPVIKYVPPAVRPLPQAPFELADDTEVTERRQNRLLVSLIFSGALSGLVVLLVWFLWPAINNFVFGPSGDPELQARLVSLQILWAEVNRFLMSNSLLLPSLLSAAVGLALMTFLMFGNNLRQNLRLE